jgi:predicted Zn-dependent peptidase
MPGSRDIAQETLSNGLRLVLLPDPTLPIVAVNLWYHVGSKHERPGRSGLAHLFEHMLFQGSAHVGTNDHFRHVQSVGGVANGSTWYDRTNYYETLPSPALDLGLWLESDRLGFLLDGLTHEKLETQRQVVMNERRQRIDNQPYGRASERLFEILFPEGHPYRWPVIGTMEEIAAATLEDVRDFFSIHYRPNNAVLSLVGDIETGAAIDAAERWFGEIAPGPRPPRVSAPLPPLEAGSRDRMSDRVQLPRLYLAFRTEPFATPGWWAASLAANLLADGKSSPLVDDLVVSEELAQDVSAYVYPTEEVGLFVVVATARPGVDPGRLEARIWSHLSRLSGANGGPGAPNWDIERELGRARRRALVALHSEIQTVDQRADLLSQYTTFFDDPARAFREPEEVAAVDVDRVRSFARDRLGADRCATLLVEPRTATP